MFAGVITKVGNQLELINFKLSLEKQSAFGKLVHGGRFFYEF